MTKNTVKSLLTAILSLSLLTVMAGAAVAPALDVIGNYFSGESKLFIQMIISMPALFIFLTSFIFGRLCKKFTAKGLVIFGLCLYVICGCISGIFDNIIAVLISRALLGVGVGIIMPLSTGLIAYHFTRGSQERLMGYSSAMNQLGGAVATLLSGLLAGISWRASFLVYLMGLISIILCVKFIPSSNLHPGKARITAGDLRQYAVFIISMFLLMITFFIYPSSFAMETMAEGIIPHHYIAIIMASMDVVALLGGLTFVHIKRKAGSSTRLLAPLLFFAGYILMIFPGGWTGTLAGSIFIGFANGLGIPYIISAASKKAGKTAVATVMPMLSAALYLAQFLTPFLLSLAGLLITVQVVHLPYCMAILTGGLLIIASYLEK